MLLLLGLRGRRQVGSRGLVLNIHCQHHVHVYTILSSRCLAAILCEAALGFHHV